MNAPDTISRRSNLDAALLARTTPLPISSYFDPGWFEREMLLLFDRGPNYVGSEMMVPERGDYMALPWTENGKVLVHGPSGVNLRFKRSTPGRYFGDHGQGWGGTSILDPKDVIDHRGHAGEDEEDREAERRARRRFLRRSLAPSVFWV